MKTRQEGFKEPLLMALRPWEEVWGTFLPAAETICFGDLPYFSPAWHWLPMYVFPWWNGNRHLDQLTASKTE